ncbi:GNAT family N-acetyltransferase [Sphaerisporangium sp. TRM90804]|uniref:GNAT family N-acetyltransferase n=1 Tax=Sphaerisporangium sp. TRM90804 TaxID=3031113 RepID=UPI00244B2BB8|nr:GNAT family N-acetyltransferase [Sphaerisporangium sp. TRM90804]MDH2425650.1 GNAT family N-acetyltransferase [Sphaerisporangium sp. TRM90804]
MVDVRSAASPDIAELVRLRGLLFRDLAAEWGLPPAASDWRERCADALTELLADDSMRIVVIDGEAGLASCGMAVVERRLPTPYNLGGSIGHVYGIVTDPAYRRRGHARAIMEDLLRWFDDRGLTRVDLHSSPDGQSLYRALGFDDHPGLTLTRRR